MKKIILFTLFFIASMSIFAQKTYKQYALSYLIKDVKSKKTGSKEAQAAQMMENSIMKTFVKDGKTKTTMSMMQGMMKIQIFMDNKTKAANLYMDMMGQKMDMTDTSSFKQKKKQSNVEKPTIVATGKKKKILGFDCLEYMSTVKSKDVELKTTYYVTNQIAAEKPSFEDNAQMPMMPSMEGIDGFPLEFTIDSKDMTMTFEATEFKEDVDAKELELPKGYKKVDMSKMGKMGF